jgi:hypothetical protein
MKMTQFQAKYFNECLIELPNDDIIEAMIAKDGLCYLLPRTARVEATLTVCFPNRDADGWYFNATRDRYIAEYDADEILVNPQFIVRFCKVAL